MMKSKSRFDSTTTFSFWGTLGKTLLWSAGVSAISGIIAGIMGVMGWVDAIPLLGDLAQSNKVVGVSGALAIVTTFIACRWFFEEAGVLIGFIILSCFGLLLLFVCGWFGHHAFNFFRAMIAGGTLVPTISFPLTFWLVAKYRP